MGGLGVTSMEFNIEAIIQMEVDRWKLRSTERGRDQVRNEKGKCQSWLRSAEGN